MYGQDEDIRAMMAQQGKICFRTCIQCVIIPASYVIKLANTAYTADRAEPSSFCAALARPLAFVRSPGCHWEPHHCLTARRLPLLRPIVTLVILLPHF